MDLRVVYKKHDGNMYPYELWWGKFHPTINNIIKSKVPFAERQFDAGFKHWWFTEAGFEIFVKEYGQIKRANFLPDLEREYPEEIMSEDQDSEESDFSQELLESWYRNGYQPLKVQRKLISKKRADGFGLFYECGISKTASSVCEFLRRKHEGRAKRLCVVVYRATLTINWLEDVKKIFDIDIEIIDGEMKQREQKIRESESLIVVTPFTTLRDEKSVYAIRDCFDMLVFDECHLAVDDKKTREKLGANGKKVRTKTGYWGLSQLCKTVKNRLALTGTPLPNKAINAFTPLMICRPDKFVSKWTFTRRYAELDAFGKPIRYRNLNELKSFLGYYGMIALKKDYCDIPPKTEMNIYCELSQRTKNALAETMHIQECKNNELKLKLDDYYIKIHQIIACPSVYYDFHSDKRKTLKDYIFNDIADDEQIIVFTSLRGAVDEILNTLGRDRCAYMMGGMTAKSESIEYNDFKSGKKQILVATIQKMGVGFNLQNARHIFMYDTVMTGADYEQGISRAWRVGQTNEVMIYNLLLDIPFEKNRHEMIDEQRKLWEKMADQDFTMNSEQKIKLLSHILQ